MLSSTLSSRHSQSSPSVTMEKGAYRMHAPPPRRSPSKLRRGHVPQSAFTAQEKRMGLIVLLLVAATLSCFGAAYYLFITRWESHVLQVAPPVSDDHKNLQVIAFELDDPPEDTVPSNSKFLSYFPHSGFHNQRIAFENALVLAHILNRTLLVPPVRLGKGTIRYVPYDKLQQFLTMSGKEWHYHCVELPWSLALRPECRNYLDHTSVTWDSLANLTSIREAQQLVERWDMTDGWAQRRLKISANETYTLKDSSPYHFRFVDSYPHEDLGSRYLQSISISQLSQISHRLLQFGTLFGSSRLRLRNPRNLLIRKEIRESMAYSNELLLEIANSVQAILGGTYMGAHVRLGDGRFLIEGQDNVRLIWWRLVHTVLGLSADDALDLEVKITNNSVLEVPRTPTFFDAATIPLLRHAALSPAPRACRRPLHTDPRYLALNTPLFISTDAPDPSSHPLLSRFYETFPCTSVLSDFSAQLAPLDQLRSGRDGLMLREFVLPFVDAIVAGKADEFVGTEGSTFSRFIEDVLWRKYHGMNILQRG